MRYLPWRPHRSVQDTHVDNPASARVLERLGLQHEGILRRRIQHPNTGPVPRDARCYALVR